MKIEDKRFWIWLSRIENVNNKIKNELLRKYKTPEKIWSLNENELIKNNIKKEQIKEILNPQYRTNIEKYIEYMNKNNIYIITINDEQYPKKLLNLCDKPFALYVKGNKEILNYKSIAIIGCRSSSKIGEKTAQNMSYELSKRNINIISGLAVGIDSYAHIGVLKHKKQEEKGKTIAVIGNRIR